MHVCFPTEKIGIGPAPKHPRAVSVELRNGNCELRLGTDSRPVCRIFEGRYLGVDRTLDSSKLGEILEKRSVESGVLVRAVQHIIEHARDDRHGCSIVLDLAADPQTIPGPKLSPPLNTASGEVWIKPVLTGMSRIDGALHIDRTGRLLGFAKILDGNYSEHEDRSRGSRYNSAIRFIEKSGNENVVVIVASEDGPVTVASGETVRALGEQRRKVSSFPNFLEELLAKIEA